MQTICVVNTLLPVSTCILIFSIAISINFKDGPLLIYLFRSDWIICYIRLWAFVRTFKNLCKKTLFCKSFTSFHKQNSFLLEFCQIQRTGKISLWENYFQKSSFLSIITWQHALIKLKKIRNDFFFNSQSVGNLNLQQFLNYKIV